MTDGPKCGLLEGRNEEEGQVMERFALARELVLQAGAALRESRLREDEIQHKSGYQDLVTRWDKETEQFLRRGISEAFPQDIIVG